jgi:hypothetical protein
MSPGSRTWDDSHSRILLAQALTFTRFGNVGPEQSLRLGSCAGASGGPVVGLQLCPQSGVNQHGSITSGLASTAAVTPSVPRRGLGTSGRSNREVSEQSIAACRDGGRPSRTSDSTYLLPANEASAYPPSPASAHPSRSADARCDATPQPSERSSSVTTSAPARGHRSHWPGSELRLWSRAVQLLVVAERGGGERALKYAIHGLGPLVLRSGET